MNPRKRNSARGQILILFTIGIVGLIGFAALAIDGSMVYSDRRNDQNGADAAALAGGWEAVRYMQENDIGVDEFICLGGAPSDSSLVDRAMDAAISSARDNGFEITEEISNPNRVWFADCISSTILPQVDLHVQIQKPVKTSLIHFFFQGPVINTVGAVTTIRPRTTVSYGNALVSTSPYCGSHPPLNYETKGGITFKGIGGANQVIVRDGGILSNTCLEGDGGVYVQRIPNDPHTILYRTTFSSAPNAFFDPAPEKTTDLLKFDPLDLKDCLGNRTQPPYKSGEDNRLQPGTYDEIKIKPSETWVMEPGLYCMKGDFSVDGTLSVDDSDPPQGITINLLSHIKAHHEYPANLLVSAGAEVHIQAPQLPEGEEPINNAFNKLLVYVDPSYHLGHEVNLGGNGLSDFSGTVYVPTAFVDIGGATDTGTEIPEYGTSIIGYDIVVHGSTVIDITYDEEMTVKLPSYMNLSQ